MGRTFDKFVTLADDRRIGYGLLQRDSVWYVRFIGPDNQRCKRSLDTEKKSETQDKAERIIAREYGAFRSGVTVTWDEAIKLLTDKFASSGRRQTTLAQYLKDLNLIRRQFSAVDGPADIDESMAMTWLETFTVGKDKRVKYDKANARQHSAHNAKNRLVSVSSLWNKWLVKELGICRTNPFANLSPPKADAKPIRHVSDEQMKEFFAYLHDFYNGWEFPILFFSVKAFTGCRLADLCGLKSEQLRNGTIVFPAGATKGRKERAVPLPTGLFDALQKYAGPHHLWESYSDELRTILDTKHMPTHRLLDGFDPERLYAWVGNLFDKYRQAFPTRPSLNSHQFRARAFTKAWDGGVNAKQASIAFGCNPDTLLKHYTALDEQKTTDDVFAKIGANILPTFGGTQKGHNSEKPPPKKARKRKGSG